MSIGKIALSKDFEEQKINEKIKSTNSKRIDYPKDTHGDL